MWILFIYLFLRSKTTQKRKKTYIFCHWLTKSVRIYLNKTGAEISSANVLQQFLNLDRIDNTFKRADLSPGLRDVAGQHLVGGGG